MPVSQSVTVGPLDSLVGLLEFANPDAYVLHRIFDVHSVRTEPVSQQIHPKFRPFNAAGSHAGLCVMFGRVFCRPIKQTRFLQYSEVTEMDVYGASAVLRQAEDE